MKTNKMARLINFIKFRKKLIDNHCCHVNETKDSFVLKTIQNNLMLLSIKDKGIQYDLIVDGIREPNSTEVIKQMITKEDIVVDIGANIGYYTLLMKNAKKIYAIESSQDNCNKLNINIRLNNLNNVSIIRKAIGNFDGTIKINISDKSNLHSINKNNKKFIATENVKITTIDSFIKTIKDKPAFVRMDVEGYEYQIIKGMKEFLKNDSKLFIEIHPHLMKLEYILQLLNTLKDNGFEIKRMFRCYTVVEIEFKDDVEYDYNIEQLINDKEIMSGSEGAFEIFFEKTNKNKNGG